MAATVIAKPGTGTLKFGLKIGETLYKDFTLREPVMADYMDAEDEAPSDKQFAFDLALLAQLTEIKGFDGVLTVALLGRLKPADFAILRRALREMSEAGEPEPAPAPPG